MKTAQDTSVRVRMIVLDERPLRTQEPIEVASIERLEKEAALVRPGMEVKHQGPGGAVRERLGFTQWSEKMVVRWPELRDHQLNRMAVPKGYNLSQWHFWNG
jgi:hypothetical protein